MNLTRQKLIFATLLFVWTVCSATPASSQTPAEQPIDGVYKGTVGNQEIVLEIGTYKAGDDKPEGPTPRIYLDYTPLAGRYFYRRKGTPYELRGDAPQQDGTVVLREQRTEPYPPDEFHLVIRNGGAVGKFCECNLPRHSLKVKRYLPVSLARVSSGIDPDLEWKSGDSKKPDQVYYDLLLDFPLQIGPEIRLNQQISYVIQTDPRFFLSLPHLTRFPDQRVMEKLNQNLAREFTTNQLSGHQCAWDGQAYLLSVLTGKPTLRLNRDVLTIDLEEMTCGRPYVSTYKTSLKYDLKTGDPR